MCTAQSSDILYLEKKYENMPRENPYYHTCPRCGANLDPGESCDCQITEKSEGSN